MDLGMQEKAVPEVMWIFRLVESTACGLDNRKIGRVVDRDGSLLRPNTFWHNMVAIE
jgi:hypothetical protein